MSNCWFGVEPRADGTIVVAAQTDERVNVLTLNLALDALKP